MNRANRGRRATAESASGADVEALEGGRARPWSLDRRRGRSAVLSHLEAGSVASGVDGAVRRAKATRICRQPWCVQRVKQQRSDPALFQAGSHARCENDGT